MMELLFVSAVAFGAVFVVGLYCWRKGRMEGATQSHIRYPVAKPCPPAPPPLPARQPDFY